LQARQSANAYCSLRIFTNVGACYCSIFEAHHIATTKIVIFFYYLEQTYGIRQDDTIVIEQVTVR
jgi:hypothetical protein